MKNVNLENEQYNYLLHEEIKKPEKK